MSYDHWCTPRHVAQIIGHVHTDPCSNEWSMISANVKYRFEDDGLNREWHGAVYVNPPYSDPAPWVKKWIAHQGPKAFLSEASVGTSWFTKISRYTATHVNGQAYDFDKRLQFYDPRTGTEHGPSRTGHRLFLVDFSIDLASLEAIALRVL